MHPLSVSQEEASSKAQRSTCSTGMASMLAILALTCVPAGVDDFVARVEVALCGYSFTGSNSIGSGGAGMLTRCAG
jgi:hypothetical protein